MTPDEATKLREPFPEKTIGKLPRKSKDGREFFLDYVGHAAVTDRLLAIDPEWTWEPMATDEWGTPVIISGIGEPQEPVGLWIRLTVCGVTRPGFGSGKTAKEAISDAIRNAAMRFGVALDLWAKEDLSSNGSGAAVSDLAVTGTAPLSGDPVQPSSDNPAEVAHQAYLARYQKGMAAGAVPSQQVIHFGKNKGTALGELTLEQLKWYAETWKMQEDASPYDARLKVAARALLRGDDTAEVLSPPDDSIPF